MSQKRIKSAFLILFFFALSHVLNAQKGTYSPYSAYGLGELQSAATIEQRAMGGLGAAIHSPDRLNFINPASYSFDTITTFEAGIKTEIASYEEGDTNQVSRNASFSYLALGFPLIKNKWGAAFGLLPYSHTGYEGIKSEANSSGKTEYTFSGEGSLNRIFIGSGFAPFAGGIEKFRNTRKFRELTLANDSSGIKQIENRLRMLNGFSLGINASWLFGTLKNTRSIEFTDADNFLNTRLINELSLGDFYFDFGLLYNYTFKNEITFDAGLTAGINSKVNSRLNSFWYNFTTLSSGFERITDTVSSLETKGNTVIPFYYSGGITIGKKQSWQAGFNIFAQDWSRYKSLERNAGLQQSFTIAAGGSWIPEYNSLRYLKKIQYRTGFSYTRSPVNLMNTDINEYGIALGFGFPVVNKDRIQKTTLQVTFEAGQKGTTSDNLIKQQYARVYFGITLNESWFFKSKYD